MATPAKLKWVAGAGVLGLLVLGAWVLRAPPLTEIYIGDTALQVQVASTPAQKIKGLSGLDKEKFRADGMLFLYGQAEELTFWMGGMQFDLDVVWIKDGEVVKIETHIPAPVAGAGYPVRMHSEPYAVNAVLEVRAGDAERFGIEVGDEVVGSY